MKIRNLLVLATIAIGVLPYGMCDPEPLPVVVTDQIYNISSTGASCNATIENDHESNSTALGLCWSTKITPTKDENEGSLEVPNVLAEDFILTNLKPSTIYYVRAYAINSVGIGYGNEVSFKTSSIVSITTASITGITSNSATCGGIDIKGIASSAIYMKGIAYGKKANPKVSDNYRYDMYANNSDFSLTMTNLEPNTVYHVRAFIYSKNAFSMDIYGADSTFTTK